MPDTLLLIGNGLAIDYRSHRPAMPDSSRPLDYPLLTPGKPGKPLREQFSELWVTIGGLRAEHPGIDDFTLIKLLRLLPIPPSPSANPGQPEWKKQFQAFHRRGLIETQLRLHITHAYTHFSMLVSDADVQSWRWFSWLAKNRDRLHGIVSFNYDLLLEAALGHIIPIRHLVQYPRLFGLHAEVALFKPHGSVNYEFADRMFHFGSDNSVIYDMRTVITLADSPVRILPMSELDRQRINSDIVLPTEATQIRDFQYISPGFGFLKHTRGDISRCIVAGLSYWDCDRPEINEILGYLGRTTQVFICNPGDTSELESFLRVRFDRVEHRGADLPD